MKRHNNTTTVFKIAAVFLLVVTFSLADNNHRRLQQEAPSIDKEKRSLKGFLRQSIDPKSLTIKKQPARPHGVVPVRAAVGVASNDVQQEVCTSGSQYMQPPGRWVYKENQPPRYPKPVKPRPGCYEQDHDNYFWSAPCVPPTVVQPKQTRALLLGDSITQEMIKSCISRSATQEYSRRNDVIERRCFLEDMPNIEMTFERSDNDYLDSVPFKTRIAECDESMRNNNFDETEYSKKFGSTLGMGAATLNWQSEDDYLTQFNHYDFTFMSDYAHFVGGIHRTLWKCYKVHGRFDITNEQIWDDVLTFYANQVERKAELLSTIKDKTLSYYRTTHPHAVAYVPATKALPEPIPQIPIDECRHTDPSEYGWKCYSAINEIATRAFVKNGLGIVDTGPALSQRIDAHPASGGDSKDALHFCFPGPPDVEFDAIVVEILARSNPDTGREK